MNDRARKHSGRPAGSKNTPEHNAAISAFWARRRGLTDEQVIEYYKAPHSIRATAERFEVTFLEDRYDPQEIQRCPAARSQSSIAQGGHMTREARAFLEKCQRQTVASNVGAPDWPAVLELQRLRFVSVKPITKYVAKIEMTDAGRAELAKQNQNERPSANER